MSKMNAEQIQACRSNPIAAYLAKRLPTMLKVSMVLNIAALIMLALALTFAISPGSLPKPVEWIHLVTTGLIGVISVAALALGLELAWMRRYQISPELFEPISEVVASGPLPYEHQMPEGETFASYGNALVQLLHNRSALYRRQHNLAKNAMEADYLRSMEVQASAAALAIEALLEGLDEKAGLGHQAHGSGYQQIKMTRNHFAAVARIIETADRKLRRVKEKPKNRLPKPICRT